MELKESLLRYRRNQFTDLDVTRCTGLTDRGWRELIKDKLVRTVTHTPGRGRIRLCDATTLKRAAAIAALNRAGLSLTVSARIAFYLPFHTALYELCDPPAVVLQGSSRVLLNGGLPPSAQELRVNWFDPERPARAEPETDWSIVIYDGRFLGAKYGPNDEPFIFGDLREAGTRAIAWLPLHRISNFTDCGLAKLGREGLGEAVAVWEDPTRWPREVKALGYDYEEHGEADPLRETAEAAVRNPIVTVTINLSLAIRRALRRYLGIEPTERGSR